MKKQVTVAAVLCLLLAWPATAQPVRNGTDVIWARDVSGAAMTLDGLMNEAAWAQAERLQLVWNGSQPGLGQMTEGSPTLAEPSDPNNGTVYLLRDGNTLWMGVMVADKSVGGATGLWGMDGLIMNILDRARFIAERKDAEGNFTTNFFQGNRTEFFYSWWNDTDTTDATSTYDDGNLVGGSRPLPGVAPRFHGFYGHNSTIGRDPAKIAVWDAVTVVDGIANDDTHGEDVGYAMEMKLDMAALGYDFTQAGGDKAAWNIALQDHDYAWPTDANLNYLSRVWWQNLWGNNFNEGIAYIMGAPGVTISSGAAPEVPPEFTVPNGTLFGDPAIDGKLDEPVWERVDPSFYVQYQAAQNVLDLNPEVVKYYMFYFRPDINNDNNAAIVVDPSLARFKMFFKGTKLYVGVDVEDQAISGFNGESGMDGIYLFLRDLDSLNTLGEVAPRRFDFRIDSLGTVQYGSDAKTFHDADPTALEAAIALKGASTAADPSDVDEGYQIEIVIDLVKVLGYPANLGDGGIWVAMNFLDGDFLDAQENSYAMRTWVITERGGGSGASVYGYLDANAVIGVAVEDEGTLPETLTLLGNYPNPFNPTTSIRYALPATGEVSIQVYDLLGRLVADLAPGVQPAGTHEMRFDASGFASGLYFYRVQTDGAAGAGKIGRMVLLK